MEFGGGFYSRIFIFKTVSDSSLESECKLNLDCMYLKLRIRKRYDLVFSLIDLLFSPKPLAPSCSIPLVLQFLNVVATNPHKEPCECSEFIFQWGATGSAKCWLQLSSSCLLKIPLKTQISLLDSASEELPLLASWWWWTRQLLTLLSYLWWFWISKLQRLIRD